MVVFLVLAAAEGAKEKETRTRYESDAPRQVMPHVPNTI